LVLVCSADLKTLFQSLKGVDEIWQPGPLDANSFHTYTPLMSLPNILNITLDNLPTPIPYLDAGGRIFSLPKHPITQAKDRWKGHKVGITWAGSPTQGRDRDRSCHLSQFIPLLKQSNCAFYSVQKGEMAEAQLQDLPDDVDVVNLGEKFTDFADTAAAIAQLDLVITVDTSVAHLSGAMGKPTWVLLCHNPDWRWMLEENTSPWYPTLRLFRQLDFGDWDQVFKTVAEALTNL
ncbi:MAG: glycosyltransferase family 9 protein, partial [Cyanophyceae cyanobacterium]